MKDKNDNVHSLEEHKCYSLMSDMASNQQNNKLGVLKDSTSNVNRIKSFRNLTCEQHEGSEMFCADCHEFACGQCNNSHNTHQVMKLTEASAYFRKQLTAGSLRVRTLIRYANIVVNDLNSNIEKLSANLSEIVTDINQRAEALPPGGEVALEALLADVAQEQTTETERLCAKIAEFEEFITKAKRVAATLDSLTNASDDQILSKIDLVLSSFTNIENALPASPVERALHILTVPQEPTEGHTLSPEEILGEFCKANVPWRIEVKRTGSFRPEAVGSTRFVTTMCAAQDEMVWVVWQWGPQVHLVDKEGNVKQTFNAGVKVDDICTDRDGNLVVSCHEAKCIKVLDSNHQEKKTIQMDKVPRGIFTNAKNETIACCVQNLHHRNGDISNVVKIKPDYETKKELSFGDRLIQPWRVAINMNGDICVSDRNKGCVEIFDSDGNFKASYSGPDMSTRHAFAPHGISCDKYGQIFVVDYTNHTVHVLDPLGRFRGFLIMDTELEKRAIFMGTSSPFSIAIDTAGDVWVGNKFGYLTVLKYFV